MKFTNGYWLNRPEYDLHFALERNGKPADFEALAGRGDGIHHPRRSLEEILSRFGEGLPVVATQPPTQQTQPDGTTLPPATVTRKSLQTASPVEGEIIMVYAMDALGYNPTTRDWRVHNGVDIAAEAGTAVCAAAEGTVYTVYEDDTMGTTVVIRHADGYVTSYSSLAQEVNVVPGDTVKLGQQIGTVGNTALLESAIGDHVHFSVTCDDEPVDPEVFLAQE